MKDKLLILILPIITLILEILPYGAVCNFFNPEGDPWRVTYSYFDLIPFGYANFAPFITAIITCIIILILLINVFFDNKHIINIAKKILFITSMISLLPLLYGINFFSVVGGLITITLVAELFLIHFIYKSYFANKI